MLFEGLGANDWAAIVEFTSPNEQQIRLFLERDKLQAAITPKSAVYGCLSQLEGSRPSR